MDESSKPSAPQHQTLSLNRNSPEYGYWRGVRGINGHVVEPHEDLPEKGRVMFGIPHEGLRHIDFSLTVPAVDGEATQLHEVGPKYARVAREALRELSDIHVGDVHEHVAEVKPKAMPDNSDHTHEVIVRGKIALDPEKQVKPAEPRYIPKAPEYSYQRTPSQKENGEAAVSFVLQAALEKANIQYETPASVWKEQQSPKKELVDRGVKQTADGKTVRDISYEHTGNFDRYMKQVPGSISVPVSKVSTNLADPITVPPEQRPEVEHVLNEALQGMGLTSDQYKIVINPEGRNHYVPQGLTGQTVPHTVYDGDGNAVVEQKPEMKPIHDAIYVDIAPEVLVDSKTLEGAKTYLEQNGSKTAEMRAKQVGGYLNTGAQISNA